MLASMTVTVVASAAPRRLAEQHAQHVGLLREIRDRPRRSPCAAILIGGIDAEIAWRAWPRRPRRWAWSVPPPDRASRRACPRAARAVAGAGTGSSPCSVFTVPLPTLSGEQTDRVDAQQVERDARADDVGDGIDRADFVEVDLLDGDLVDGRLRLAQALEDRRGVAASTRSGNGRGVDHPQNVAGAGGPFARRSRRGTWWRRCRSASPSRSETSRPYSSESSADNPASVGAGIGQRAHQHVAADAGECVEIADFLRHELLSLYVAPFGSPMNRAQLLRALSSFRLFSILPRIPLISLSSPRPSSPS